MNLYPDPRTDPEHIDPGTRRVVGPGRVLWHVPPDHCIRGLDGSVHCVLIDHRRMLGVRSSERDGSASITIEGPGLTATQWHRCDAVSTLHLDGTPLIAHIPPPGDDVDGNTGGMGNTSAAVQEDNGD